MNLLKTDNYYMKRALSLAARGTLAVRPNPRVGAVLVKAGRVIASAYHSRYGGPHAEVKVLKKAGPAARGGTLYVTLEPCSSYGKTPPCTESMISSKVGRVVIGCRDRDPRNRNRAEKILTRAGIQVVIGILEDDCRSLNRDFFIWAEERRPYTTLKLALSLDGKIADRHGRAKWISSQPSRRYAHYLRSRSDAILIGLKTVIADDPLLTVRMGYAHPGLKKVVLDSQGRIPLTARLVRGENAKDIILATTPLAPPSRLKEITGRGVTLVKVPARAGRVSLKTLFRRLAAHGIMRLLVEGGGETAASLLEEGLVDEIHLFIAPIIIGGRDAPSAVGGRGVRRIKDAYRLHDMVMERLGGDIHISGHINKLAPFSR